MDILDLGRLGALLCSTELSVQIKALAEIQNTIEELLELAVRGLAVTSNPMIYADYLSQLGPRLIKPLGNAMMSLPPGDARFHSAALLLFFGDRSYVREILDEFQKGGSNEVFAANKLARAGVKDVAGPLLTRLEKLPDEFYDEPRNSIYVQTLLDCLTIVEVDLPEPLWHRIRSSAASRYIVRQGPTRTG